MGDWVLRKMIQTGWDINQSRTLVSKFCRLTFAFILSATSIYSHAGVMGYSHSCDFNLECSRNFFCDTFNRVCAPCDAISSIPGEARRFCEYRASFYHLSGENEISTLSNRKAINWEGYITGQCANIEITVKKRKSLHDEKITTFNLISGVLTENNIFLSEGFIFSLEEQSKLIHSSLVDKKTVVSAAKALESQPPDKLFRRYSMSLFNELDTSSPIGTAYLNIAPLTLCDGSKDESTCLVHLTKGFIWITLSMNAGGSIDEGGESRLLTSIPTTMAALENPAVNVRDWLKHPEPYPLLVDPQRKSHKSSLSSFLGIDVNVRDDFYTSEIEVKAINKDICHPIEPLGGHIASESLSSSRFTPLMAVILPIIYAFGLTVW